MAWFRAYGKVSEYDQANLEACRKTRRRFFIIILSTLLLVAVIVAAVVGTQHGKDSSSSSPQSATPSLSTSIKAICDATLYPTSCFASLSPIINSTSSLDPVNLFKLSVQVAKDELSKASGRLQGLGIDKAALSDCEELIRLSIDHLDDSFSSTSADHILSSSEAVDDLKTWLSASITNQHTCIDGLSNSTIETRDKAAESLNSSTELTSNSLAILTQFTDFLGSLNLRRRLMGHHKVDDRSPSWLSRNDHRRLLKDDSDPRKTANIVVAKDGSSKYKTITAALAAVPAKSSKRFVIYVKKGVYSENVRVENNKWNVVMVGDGSNLTIVSAGLNFVDGTPTFQTATFAVFGKNFIGRDIGFRNSAGAAKQQAVAMMSDSDRSVFYRCKFDAFQDTLYVHSLRQLYRECDIYGTVDFIFGNAAAVLQNCNIYPRVPMLGQQDTITAQGKVDPNQNTGLSIHDSIVAPFGDLKLVKVYLGRPWKNYSTTVFMRTTMAGIIDPTGWMPWTGDSAPDTIFYSEYHNFGPGSVTKGRVKWKGLRIMTSKQATKFTVGAFIKGDSWVPMTSVPFKSGL